MLRLSPPALGQMMFSAATFDLPAPAAKTPGAWTTGKIVGVIGAGVGVALLGILLARKVRKGKKSQATTAPPPKA